MPSTSKPSLAAIYLLSVLRRIERKPSKKIILHEWLAMAMTVGEKAAQMTRWA